MWPKCSPKSWHHFILPPAMHKRIVFTMSSTSIYIFSFLNLCYSCGFKMVCRCSFNVAPLDETVMVDRSHVCQPVSLLYVGFT